MAQGSLTAKDRLGGNEVLVLDGAIGTELEARGLQENHDASWALCNEGDAEILADVHEAYIASGADIITTNTYASGLHALTQIGEAANFDSLNRRAVEVALAARGGQPQSPLVAGSVSAFGNGAMRYNGLTDGIQWGEADLAILRASIDMQARLLVDAGVDVILLEMLGAQMADLDTALDAVASLDVPVLLALSAMASSEHDHLVLQELAGDTEVVEGASLASAVARVAARPLAAVLVHHMEIDVTDRAIREVSASWDGRIGVYPNRTGLWDGTQWIFEEGVTADKYADLAEGWVDLGASIIGGCCGVGPSHIAAIARRFG